MVSTSLELGSTELTSGQWNRLRKRLGRDYPTRYIIIRSVMRRELGFVARHHSEWISKSVPHQGVADRGYYRERGYYRDCVYLDWYDGSKKTFFMLKYSEYIQQ